MGLENEGIKVTVAKELPFLRGWRIDERLAFCRRKTNGKMGYSVGILWKCRNCDITYDDGRARTMPCRHAGPGTKAVVDMSWMFSLVLQYKYSYIL